MTTKRDALSLLVSGFPPSDDFFLSAWTDFITLTGWDSKTLRAALKSFEHSISYTVSIMNCMELSWILIVQASAFSWAVIHWELWISVQLMAERRLSIRSQNKRENIPKGYSFKFSRGTHCPCCAYKHSNFKFDASLAQKFCNFRPSSKSPGAQPPTSSAASTSTNS